MRIKKSSGLLAAVTALMMAVTLMPGLAFAENGETAVPEGPENGIPLIIINVEEQELLPDDKGNLYGSIANMNASPDHSVRCRGTVDILVPEGYQSIYGGEASSLEGLTLSYIRGRGNSTWGFAEKKPYKIKFDKKQDLFGMGADKEWALMANAWDVTFMKNRITSWLGEEMGMPYTPRMIPVDVVMKGSYGSTQYLGSYCLSELVATGKSRVDIADLDKDTESEAEGDDPNVTGGYLISFYNEMQDDDVPRNSLFRTPDAREFFTRSPEYEGEDESSLTEGQKKQRSYLSGYLEELEGLILEPEQIDSATHEKIEAMMDLESLADYWLIQEFSKNGDAFCTSSTYLYKDRNGKLCWGPLWDFDLAWGQQDDLMSLEEYSPIADGFNNTEMKWIDALREKDPQFGELLLSRWEIMDRKLQEMTKKNGVIDRFRKETEESRKDDVLLWPPEIEGEKVSLDYDLILEKLKKWIDCRRDWFNEHLDEITKVNVTISYKVDGEIIEKETVRRGGAFYMTPDDVEKEGMYLTGWYTEEGHESIDDYRADEDTVFVAEFHPCRFADVQDPDRYFFKPVYWAVEEEITNGTTETTFSPDASCTRGQIVTFQWRAMDSPEPESTENPFSDVKEDSYFYKAVLWAVENKITTGTGADTFSPDAACTRAQVVTFLHRCQGIEDVWKEECPFSDVKEDSYYYDSVLWATGTGITEGTSETTFSPDQTCTRGQIVTFLYRTFAY